MSANPYLDKEFSMKFRTKLTAAALCLIFLICLFGCHTNTPVETTEPTLSAADVIAAYKIACKPITASPIQHLTIQAQEQRTVGGETYTETVNGTAYYTGLGKDTLNAEVDVTLTNGTYESKYVESYTGGTAYIQVMDCAFSAPMTQDEFLARQIPAILLDTALYSTATFEHAEAQTILHFSDASALESWVSGIADIELLSAEGTAILDETGALLETSYSATYISGAASYTLEVSVAVSTEALNQSAIAPAESTPLAFFDFPRLLLRSIGDIYAAQSMTCAYQESLTCQAAGIVRSQHAQIDTWGTGTAFMGCADYTASLTNYTDTATVNTQRELFRDGVYSYSVNEADPVTQSGVTAEQMRSYCKDSVLSAFFSMDSVAGAELTDTGDFYCILFTGSELLADSLCSSIYSILGVDLDSYADSYTTEAISGYLTIDKHTGLPTAAGMTVMRTHIIGNVAYALSYQLDQSVNLSSATSYKSITGEMQEEAVPETPATPLFYQVTGSNGQKMWLLGTIHVGDERTAFLPDVIMNAFKESSALAVEFDMNAFSAQTETDTQLQSQIANTYYYADGSTIDSHIDSALYEKAYPLFLASGSNSINAPYMKTALWHNLIDNFYLQQSYSLIADKGVDQRLLDRAEAEGKTILSIESGLAQLQMLTGYSAQLQELLLAETVEMSLAEYSEDIRQLYELWCQGDEAALTDALITDTADLTEEEQLLYAEYNKSMMTDRNAIMLNAAKGYLESGDTVFYAVGLAHLLGEDGLVNTLRAAGYTVQIVTYE